MKALLLALGLATGHGAPAQMLLITEVERRDGVRELNVGGPFTDADTVLVQVYHDSDVLTEEVFTHSWALVLGTFESYEVKFTDAQRRVKRLSIHELSDDQLEWVPPIEIDFGAQGNLVMIKPRDHKPDFNLYDVGMSRKR